MLTKKVAIVAYYFQFKRLWVRFPEFTIPKRHIKYHPFGEGNCGIQNISPKCLTQKRIEKQ